MTNADMAIAIIRGMCTAATATHFPIWQHATTETVALGSIGSLDYSFQGVSFLCAGSCELLQPSVPKCQKSTDKSKLPVQGERHST